VAPEHLSGGTCTPVAPKRAGSCKIASPPRFWRDGVNILQTAAFLSPRPTRACRRGAPGA
jgi:hypothetical protein